MIPDLRAAWLTLALCLVFPGTASAQRDTLEVDDVSPQLWVDYDPSVQVSPRVQLFGDFGARTEIESGGWSRIVARPSVRYDISGQTWIGGGIGNFYTFNDVIAADWEIRPWQGVEIAWPKWKFPIHYVDLGVENIPARPIPDQPVAPVGDHRPRGPVACVRESRGL